MKRWEGGKHVHLAPPKPTAPDSRPSRLDPGVTVEPPVIQRGDERGGGGGQPRAKDGLDRLAWTVVKLGSLH